MQQRMGRKPFIIYFFPLQNTTWAAAYWNLACLNIKKNATKNNLVDSEKYSTEKTWYSISEHSPYSQLLFLIVFIHQGLFKLDTFCWYKDGNKLLDLTAVLFTPYQKWHNKNYLCSFEVSTYCIHLFPCIYYFLCNS